jgi:hypothetical protein
LGMYNLSEKTVSLLGELRVSWTVMGTWALSTTTNDTPMAYKGSSFWEGLALLAGICWREMAVLPGQDLQNQQIRGMKARHGDMIQVFIGLRNVAADQSAQLVDRHS